MTVSTLPLGDIAPVGAEPVGMFGVVEIVSCAVATGICTNDPYRLALDLTSTLKPTVPSA